MKLSSLLSDGMVLQRDAENRIWGTEAEGSVSVSVLSEGIVIFTGETAPGDGGSFEILLPALPAGGPYEIRILDACSIRVIRDVLAGDVFLLAGQSNMELPVRRTLDLTAEYVKTADDPWIRAFEVPKRAEFHGPVSDLCDGSWKQATQENLYDFSALGFFFAEQIRRDEGVPVGLLETALGGVQIEALIPEERLLCAAGKLIAEAEARGEKKEKDGVLSGNHYNAFFYEDAVRLDRDDAYVEATLAREARKNAEFFRFLDETDIGLLNHWESGNSLFAAGEEVQYLEVPGRWENLPEYPELESLRGSVWVLKRFQVPEQLAGKTARLVLGTVIDADETFLNGVPVGRTEYRYPPRRYPVPAGILRKENTLAVRVKALGRAGGFVPEMPYFLECEGTRIPLCGLWEWRTGTNLYESGKEKYSGISLPEDTFFNYRPCGIYNAMIHPLRRMCMKAMLFYQGESNTLFWRDYSFLMELMARSVRDCVNDPGLPIVFAELPYFGQEDEERGTDNWDRLREAQERAARSIPNSALADLWDLGQRYELHPQNKREAAERMHEAYRKLLPASGPDHH